MSEDFRGVFAASMSVLKADLSLDIEATISHAKKNLDENGVGSAFFGSTGAGQLIGIRMKKEFISELSKEKFKEKKILSRLYFGFIFSSKINDFVFEKIPSAITK